MARKKEWFNPYHNHKNKGGNRASSTSGREKGKKCQKTPEKCLLVSARCYKVHPKLYARWDELFRNE